MAKDTMVTYTPDITARFLRIRDEVLAEGSANSQAEFGRAVGEHSQNFSMMEKGTRAPTLDQCARACEKFGYSANWLLLGIGPVKINPGLNAPLEQRVTTLEIGFKNLMKKVKDLSKNHQILS